jgi:H+/Cl- antiporter ClcA
LLLFSKRQAFPLLALPAAAYLGSYLHFSKKKNLAAFAGVANQHGTLCLRGMKVPRSANFSRLRRSPLLSWRIWRRRVVFWVGAVVVSVVAIEFAKAADASDRLFHLALGVSPWTALAIVPLGLAFCVWLTENFFPGAQGSGIPQVIASLEMNDPEQINRVLSLRVGIGKILLTLIGLACGASIGREGPTVQVGASIMQALGRILNMPRAAEQRALVLAGGAAGIAAAFNTPLAGVVFAIEELSQSFESRTSGVVLTAVIIAGIATTAMMGNYTYFGVTAATLPIGIGWIAVLVCAFLGGLSGGLFADALVRAARATPGVVMRFARARPIIFAGLCGLAIALLGLVSNGATYGTGYAQARALVAGQSHLPVQFFVLKFLASLVSYVSGIPGGIFAPSLAVGAGLGRAIAHLMPAAPTGAVVLLGMVAYFSGVVQAPITAAVIVMEMTDNQDLMIPLMTTSLLATGVSRLVCRRPLYGTLARRFLATQPVVPGAVSGMMADEALDVVE